MRIIQFIIDDTKIQEAGETGQTDNYEIIHSFAAGDILNLGISSRASG